MFVKNISRMHSTTPLWKESPEIRILWFSILMHIDERGYISATPNELKLFSELPGETFEKAFDFLTGISKKNSTKYIINTEKGLRVNCFDRNKKNRIDSMPKWKENSMEGFNAYIDETKQGYQDIIHDYAFLLELKDFFPYYDIGLSLQKAFSVYWGTESAWKKRKRKRGNTFNWKLTIANTLKYNLVKTVGKDYEREYFETMIKKQSQRLENASDK